MEGSRYTQPTLDLVFRVRKEFENVGAVIQAYLYRSEQDVRRLLEARTRIRLCKGAYLEPESIAFKEKRDTDANFVKLMKLLLDSGIYHGIATHDLAMIGATKRYARERNIDRISLSFRCCMACGARFNNGSAVRDTTCGSIFLTADGGIPISCAVWRNGPPTFCSS